MKENPAHDALWWLAYRRAMLLNRLWVERDTTPRGRAMFDRKLQQSESADLRILLAPDHAQVGDDLRTVVRDELERRGSVGPTARK